jgi:hypothetical protein
VRAGVFDRLGVIELRRRDAFRTISLPARATRKWRRNALESLKTDSEMAAGSAGRPSRGETNAQAAFGCAAAFAWAAAFGRRASMAISARSLRTASRSREFSHARASSRV